MVLRSNSPSTDKNSGSSKSSCIYTQSFFHKLTQQGQVSHAELIRLLTIIANRVGFFDELNAAALIGSMSGRFPNRNVDSRNRSISSAVNEQTQPELPNQQEPALLVLNAQGQRQQLELRQELLPLSGPYLPNQDFLLANLNLEARGSSSRAGQLQQNAVAGQASPLPARLVMTANPSNNDAVSLFNSQLHQALSNGSCVTIPQEQLTASLLLQNSTIAAHLWSQALVTLLTSSAWQPTQGQQPELRQASTRDESSNPGRAFLPGTQEAPSAAVAQQPTRSSANMRPNEGPAKLTNRPPIPLFLECDEDTLSEYQCLLRKQIEVFEASPEDVRRSAQGRNTPISLGQVGIRCRHCANAGDSIPSQLRGAVYFSQTVDGIYQVAQNMSKVHFCGRCPRTPEPVKKRLSELRGLNQRASGGKKYWTTAAKALGIFEEGRLLRFIPRDGTNRFSSS